MASGSPSAPARSSSSSEPERFDNRRLGAHFELTSSEDAEVWDDGNRTQNAHAAGGRRRGGRSLPRSRPRGHVHEGETAAAVAAEGIPGGAPAVGRLPSRRGGSPFGG